MLVDVRGTRIGLHNKNLPPDLFAQQGSSIVRMLIAHTHSAQA